MKVSLLYMVTLLKVNTAEFSVLRFFNVTKETILYKLFLCYMAVTITVELIITYQFIQGAHYSILT